MRHPAITSFVFKKIPRFISTIDIFCTFVLSLAGKSLATGGRGQTYILRRLLTLCFDIKKLRNFL